MAGYHWQCSNCKQESSFSQVKANTGIAKFIWQTLLPANWNYNLLIRECPQCHEKEMRITFEFPRQQNPELLQVKQIVGLPVGNYLPMMWESFPFGSIDESWFSFNYITLVDGKINSWGLNKAAVLDEDEFSKLTQVYERCTGRKFI